jgi:hypothetical protein
MPLVERIRRIAPLLQLRAQFACQLFMFLCVARILDWHPVGLWSREIACTAQFRQIESRRQGDASRLIGSPQRLHSCHKRIDDEISSGILFCFRSHTCFSFF